MFFFKKHKTLSHKQCTLIGFVLGLLSLLTTAIVVFGFPFFGAWLNVNGVFYLDLFLLAFVIVVFLAVQGLLLFGFPLYYAKDKKSHMTGFQILLHALMWMIVMVFVVSLFGVIYQNTHSSADLYNFDDMDALYQEIESAQ